MEVCLCRLSHVTGLCISHESVTQEGDGHRFYASLNQVCLNCNDAIKCFMGSFWEVLGRSWALLRIVIIACLNPFHVVSFVQ